MNVFKNVIFPILSMSILAGTAPVALADPTFLPFPSSPNPCNMYCPDGQRGPIRTIGPCTLTYVANGTETLYGTFDTQQDAENAIDACDKAGVLESTVHAKPSSIK